jgi:hypothetical protein
MRAALGIIAGLLCAAAACWTLPEIAAWGHFIPTDNVVTDYACALVFALMIAVGIALSPIRAQERNDLLLLWFFRCATTLGFMLFYENNYGLDAYGYFADAKESSYDWDSVGFGQGTGVIGAIVWYLNRIVPFADSFHSLKVAFSLIGFISVYLFYSALVYYHGSRPRWLLLSIGGFPSLIFWSSILGKDPVILFGFCLYGAGILCFLRNGRLLPLALAVAGGLGAAWIRPWTAVILVVPTVVGVLLRWRNLAARVSTLAIGSVALVRAAQMVAEKFSVIGVDDLVKKANVISKAWSVGGSRQEVPDFTNVSEMLTFAPLGMFTALFRPLPGEVMNIFGGLAGIENAVLLYLVFSGLRRARRADFKDPAAIWGIALLTSWSFVYGFVSTQNLGSAFRFRLQVLPAVVALALYFRFKQRAGRAVEARVYPERAVTNHLVGEVAFHVSPAADPHGEAIFRRNDQLADGARERLGIARRHQ